VPSQPEAGTAEVGLEGNHLLLSALKSLTEDLALSVSAGDVILLQNSWYVTHAGLLRIAKRNRCSGMKVQFIRELSDPAARRFAFEATVFKSRTCRDVPAFAAADGLIRLQPNVTAFPSDRTSARRFPLGGSSPPPEPFRRLASKLLRSALPDRFLLGESPSWFCHSTENSLSDWIKNPEPGNTLVN